MGVLTQTVGPWDRPVASLSRLLDSVATGWPRCLQAMAAVALLVREATKLTLGQDLVVRVPHEVNTLLGDPHKWLSNSLIIQYQGLLCENPNLCIEPCQTLIPATFLPVGEGGSSHDCGEVLEEVYASRPDFRDQPILDPDWVLYTDGTNLIKQGQRLSGYTIVTEKTIIEAGSLTEHWSARRAELWALIHALQLSKGKRVNIFTDSRYAFATVHVHGALYKERGLLTASGKHTKNKEEILSLLDAIWEPENVAVIHCREHQKEDTRGNPGSGKQTGR